VVNEDSVARFEAAVVDARRDGDVAVGGGRPDLPGLFVEPTVVTGLPRGHRLERDELFLPFVTVSTVGSLDEASPRPYYLPQFMREQSRTVVS
jgi:1-pyrroline-5-carboxylate dehydrogenase